MGKDQQGIHEIGGSNNFWHDYLTLVISKGIPENNARWCVKWAERFARSCRQIPESNYDIRTGQELLGHSDVSTTMIYTHVLTGPGLAVKSPADK